MSQISPNSPRLPHSFSGKSGLSRELDRRPLYARLAAHLEEMIASEMRPGDRLPPENELAKQFQVSPVTMREALTSLARTGLVVRRRGSGTVVQDRSRWSHVAVLMPRFLSRQRLTPNFTMTYDLLCRELDRRSIANTLYVGRLDSFQSEQAPAYPELEDAMANGRVRGVINLFRIISDELRGQILSRQIPFVTSMGANEAADASVFTDLAPGIRESVRWLHRRGRRKLAFIHFRSTSDQAAADHGPLFAAFREGLDQCGLPFEPAWTRSELSPGDRGAGWEEFREIWSARSERPDGLLIGDEGFFPDVATVILEMGIRVPDQLEVVTQSTHNSDQLCPFPVTKIEVDPAATVATLVNGLETLLAARTVSNPAKTLLARFLPHAILSDEIHPLKTQTS